LANLTVATASTYMAVTIVKLEILIDSQAKTKDLLCCCGFCI